MKYDSKAHYLKAKYKCCNKDSNTRKCNTPPPKCTNRKQRVSNLKIGHSERAIYLIKRIYPYFKSISNSDGTFDIHPHDHSRSFAIHKKSMDYIIGCKNETNIESKSYDDCRESRTISPLGNAIIKIEKFYERTPYNEDTGDGGGDGGGGDGGGDGSGGDDGGGGGDGIGDGTGDGSGGGGDGTGDGGDLIELLEELINELNDILGENTLPNEEIVNNVKCYLELPQSEILEELNQQIMQAFIQKLMNLLQINNVNG